MFVPPLDLADRNTREKPYLEWVRGKFYPKMSPQAAHGRLQAKLSAILLLWGESRGFVSTETDTNVTPDEGDTRRYLPDVGFWSFARLRATNQMQAPVPDIPPDLAIEVASPTESKRYRAEKVRAYLAAGATVVLVVDPKRRSIGVHDARGCSEVAAPDAFEHPAFPDLKIAPAELFAILDVR